MSDLTTQRPIIQCLSDIIFRGGGDEIVGQAQGEDDRLFFAETVPPVGAEGGVEAEVAKVDCI